MMPPRARGLSMAGTCTARGRHAYTDLDPSPRQSLRQVFIFAASLLGLFTVGAVFQVERRRRQQPYDAVPEALAAKSVPRQTAATAANISLWNSYSLDDDAHHLDRLYPWHLLAEPYKTSVLTIDTLEDGFEANVRWTIDGIEVGTGAAVNTVFETPGAYPCSVTVSYSLPSPSEDRENPKTDVQGSGNRPNDTPKPFVPDTMTHDFEVNVKYVRREIRDLTDRDRETFFNAVSVLQRVPSAVGREVYGNKYYSKDFFNRLHLHYGGQKDCDHWHDGAGFVTSHIAISLMYEQALQSVNPSIALPYWDFTIEGSMYDWTDFRTSGVFSDDWFGDAAPRNPLMTPQRGRFGFVPVMANATEYSKLFNSYGLLRSPWNSHPDPFLTRHDRLFGYTNNRKPAGCKQYRDAVKKNTWMLLTESMNAGAHGHIHELLGGAWASEWSGFYGRTEEIVLPITHIIVPLMKYVWRAGYLACPESCNLSVKWADCQCSLNEEAVAGQKPSEVLQRSGVLSKAAGAFFYDQDLNLIENLADDEGRPYAEIPGYTEEETEDIYAEMLRVLTTPMRIGSHYEGTSTDDMTFFVIHTTFDRLWHLNRLEDSGQTHFDETWRDDHPCYGHNPGDVQPFHDLFLVKDSREEHSGVAPTSGVAPPKEYYTNRMLYDLFKPDGMATPYVYNHFQWPHCDALGIHLRGHDSR
eukprot:g20643.t1